MKRTLLIPVILAASVLPTSYRASADLINVFCLDALVRGGNLADAPNLAATNTSGYLEIKSGRSLSSTSRKSYFQFDVGSNPNTNANAIFTLVFPTITAERETQPASTGARQAGCCSPCPTHHPAPPATRTRCAR